MKCPACGGEPSNAHRYILCELWSIGNLGSGMQTCRHTMCFSCLEKLYFRPTVDMQFPSCPVCTEEDVQPNVEAGTTAGAVRLQLFCKPKIAYLALFTGWLHFQKKPEDENRSICVCQALWG